MGWIRPQNNSTLRILPFSSAYCAAHDDILNVLQLFTHFSFLPVPFQYNLPSESHIHHIITAVLLLLPTSK